MNDFDKENLRQIEVRIIKIRKQINELFKIRLNIEQEVRKNNEIFRKEQHDVEQIENKANEKSRLSLKQKIDKYTGKAIVIENREKAEAHAAQIKYNTSFNKLNEIIEQIEALEKEKSELRLQKALLEKEETNQDTDSVDAEQEKRVFDVFDGYNSADMKVPEKLSKNNADANGIYMSYYEEKSPKNFYENYHEKDDDNISESIDGACDSKKVSELYEIIDSIKTSITNGKIAVSLIDELLDKINCNSNLFLNTSQYYGNRMYSQKYVSPFKKLFVSFRMIVCGNNNIKGHINPTKIENVNKYISMYNCSVIKVDYYCRIHGCYYNELDSINAEISENDSIIFTVNVLKMIKASLTGAITRLTILKNEYESELNILNSQ